ncbi:hypothetical protein Tco_1015087 [Tanacetum coccineum]|uniref:Uncharacterized protein n=1 Tax=Tanacetum coccineum TaxID=301880 RepID=A0ABQ5FM83_9ASTR
MAKQSELNNKMCKGTGQRKNRPVWNNVNIVNHQNQFVPTAVLTRTGRIQVNTARASSTNNINTVRASSTKNVSSARHNFNSQAVPTNAARKVNTVKPIMNNVRPKTVLLGGKEDTSKLSPQMVVFGDPKWTLLDKGNIDWKQALPCEYQDFNRWFMCFWSSKGYILVEMCDKKKKVKGDQEGIRNGKKLVLTQMELLKEKNMSLLRLLELC